jgi:hypothetical protein
MQTRPMFNIFANSVVFEGVPQNLQLLLQSAAAFAASLHTGEHCNVLPRLLPRCIRGKACRQIYNCRCRVLPRLLPRCIRGSIATCCRVCCLVAYAGRRAIKFTIVVAECCRVCCLVAYAGRRAIKCTILVAECCRVCCLVAYAGRRHCNVLPRLPPRCTRGQCVANVAYVTIHAFHVCHLSSSVRYLHCL